MPYAYDIIDKINNSDESPIVVVSGHSMCHPETCTCDNWHIRTKKKGKFIYSSDSLELIIKHLQLTYPKALTAVYARWPDFTPKDYFY